ncbi:MAG: hypothetical protein ABSF83_15295 [Nitrososphaerales archaeon]|jgi:hypothetical protein
MTPERPVVPFAQRGTALEAGLLEAVSKAPRLLGRDSLYLLHRTPIVDEGCQEVSDVDLVSIWRRPDERPERLAVETAIGRVLVDVLWIPASELLDPLAAAGYMMLPHLLLESRAVSPPSGPLASMVENVKRCARERGPWGRRLGEQVGFGDAALREASRNPDFPPAALFYLQTARSYYAMALADARRRGVMGLLTRPMARLRAASSPADAIDLEGAFGVGLNLEGDASPSLDALTRVHRAAAARGSASLARSLGERVSGHYLYSISPLELEYRKAVAGALIRRGENAEANLYLRFWAYSVSRCPVVLDEARSGRKTSFYVPSRTFRESMLASCPEALDDLATIMGGDPAAVDLRAAVDGTQAFRALALESIREAGLRPTLPGGAAPPPRRAA